MGIIAFIVILLHFSVTVYVSADKSGFKFRVKYLGFTVYPRPKKPDGSPGASAAEDILHGEEKFAEDIAADDLSIVKDSEQQDGGSASSQESADHDTSILQNTEEINADSAQDSAEQDTAENEDTQEPAPPAQEEKAHKEKRAAKKKEKGAKKAKSKKEDSSGKKKEGLFSSLKSKYQKVRPYIPLAWKSFKKLLKTVRFEDLNAYVSVGRFDAHEAVIYYGAIQAAMFGLLGNLANIFTVKIKRAAVDCVFGKNTIGGEFSTYVRVRPSAVIALAVCTGVNFLIILLREKRKRKRENKNMQTKNSQSAENINQAATAV